MLFLQLIICFHLKSIFTAITLVFAQIPPSTFLGPPSLKCSNQLCPFPGMAPSASLLLQPRPSRHVTPLIGSGGRGISLDLRLVVTYKSSSFKQAHFDKFCSRVPLDCVESQVEESLCVLPWHEICETARLIAD